MPSPLAGIARFPRVRLGHAPTPIDPAPNLGAALGIDLRIKRDDCTGLAFGGNKVRQLEFHFGEAEARGADTVLVTGAVQSNLVRIAAAAARKLGMAVHIQLEDRVDGMGALYRASGNLLLDRVLGATLHAFPEGEDEGGGGRGAGAARGGARGRGPQALRNPFRPRPCAARRAWLCRGRGKRARRRPEISASASTPWSAPRAARSLMPGCWWACGRSASKCRSSASACVATPRARPRGWRRWRGALAAMIDCPAAFDAGDVDVSDAVLAPGYGRLNEAVREAMAMAAGHEGLLLDPVYTAKAMAGMIAHVRSGRIAAGSRVLFIHTGGQPALFAYAESLGSWLSETPGTPAC